MEERNECPMVVGRDDWRPEVAPGEAGVEGFEPAACVLFSALSCQQTAARSGLRGRSRFKRRLCPASLLCGVRIFIRSAARLSDGTEPLQRKAPCGRFYGRSGAPVRR